jgi:hypothetical protein
MKRINFLATFAVSMAATVSFLEFRTQAAAPPTPQGFITAREYLNLTGTTLGDLTNAAKFPNSPDVVDYPARLEWPTGPDDSTPPPGDVKNNYGIQVIGYFYPPTTGLYRFAISADDNAALYLSTNSDPANKQRLCIEAGWNTVRNWDGQETDRGRAMVDVGTADERWNNQSKPIQLTAGQVYYIEALEKEGGGGDNVAVAYRTDGAWPTVGAGDLPIPGSQLSTIDKTSGPISIITQPQSQSVGENQPVSFKVEANGTPPYSYQWQNSPSGSTTYTDILDATNQTYTITAVLAADNGSKFRCNVSNAGGSIASSSATLTVSNDTTPPTIASVKGSGTFNRATIVFSEPVTAASAGAMANYQFTGTPSLAISAVTVINPTTVVLSTGTQTEGASYTLTVNNIKDIAAAANTIAPNSTATLRAFVFSVGYAAWERWQDVGGDTAALQTFEDNLADPAFRPPDVTGVSGFFGSPRDVADNYGIRVTGFFVPTVTGSYVFYLQCDDQGDLFLSTDATPANKKRIANQPGWGPINQWIDPDTTETQSDMYTLSEWPGGATAINLTAGTRYFMESDFREGGGGDGVEVYYKLAASPLPVNGAAPNTTGVVIGTFADPTGSSVTINQQPQSLTLNEGRKARFSVTATGSSTIIYKWQKAASGSSTFTDIVGANSSSYTTANLVVADNGTKYRVVLSVLGGATATSTEATLTVVPDTFAPVVVGAGSLKKGAAIEIGVGFDEPVDEASASLPANYSLSSGTVSGVRFQKYVSAGDGPGSGEFGSSQGAVVLTTTGLTAPGTVTLTVRNVKDLLNNAIPAAGVTKTVTLTTAMNWVGVGGNDYVDGTTPPADPASQWPDDAIAYSDKDFDLVSGGSAQWDGYDELTFVYQSITGDFDKKVRVEYQDPSSQWARAGMMIREALDEGVKRTEIFDETANPTGVKMSQVFTTRVNPAVGHIIDQADPSTRSPANNSYEVIHRPRAGYRYGGTGEGVDAAFNIAAGFGGAPPYPNAWIRIKREGQKITTWKSDDGVTWTGGANVTYTDIAATVEVETLTDTLFVGMYYAPEMGNNNCRLEVGHSVVAKFRDYGDVGGGGGPVITFSQNGNNLVLSWTGSGSLEGSPVLPATTWTPITGTSPVTVPIGTANQFIRVKQ